LREGLSDGKNKDDGDVSNNSIWLAT
jgi:hypothetical protein